MSALRDVLECAPRACVDVVARWLEAECGYDRWHVGIRWPPAFMALLADVVAEQLLAEEGVVVGCLPESATGRRAAPHPYQVYSVWLLYGWVDLPTVEEVTAGWARACAVRRAFWGKGHRAARDATQLSLLADEGGRCTETVIGAWQ